MRFSTVSGAVLAAASLAQGKEIAKDPVKALDYDSGKVHAANKKKKVDLWLGEYEAGLLDSSKWPRLNYTKCIDGKAEAVPGDPLQTFKCKNMDLYDFWSHAALGSPGGWDELGDGNLLTGSSSWGWVDPESGREFVASGLYDGTALLEVLPEGKLIQLGFLPSPAPTNPDSLWKEVRGYKSYMLIGSELENHGIQIFDMRKLLDLDQTKPATFFHPIDDLTGYIDDLPEGASHNVVVSEEGQFAAAVGSRPRNSGCRAGLILYDLKDPSKPTRVGCNGNDGYVHDAQCLVYRGPSEKYVGRDICYGYNEDSLTIYDVTDKANSSIISITSYEGATYTHQGWVLDTEWQEYLFMNDEIDEIEGNGLAVDGYPVTYIWDIRDLENPKQTGFIKGTERSVDHNLYVTKDKLIWQSDYTAGVRIYDASSIPEDPTGDSVCEIAYFDIYPEDDSSPVPLMSGSWSSFLFPSGFVFINTIERGGYLVKLTRRESCPKKHVCNADNCLRALRSTSVQGRLEESQEFCAGFTDGWTADVGAVPTYAAKACGENVISRVSSACSCLPTPTAA
ncbi:hypothetical protein HJFPF1_09781 [Paramyrothecium foliicola]|nr:hypothetical protein HJFPF1_09781 [Paramyrothecium foliicola]